jgi:hypothetical protein
MRAWVLIVLSLCCSAVRAEPGDAPLSHSDNAVTAGLMWGATQLVPSPLLVIGERHVGAGMRWQLTPLLYSFGIAARPFRSFIVSPIARHSGSIELHASPEWSCCAAHGDSSWLLRTGLRVYLPLIEHGEILSWSIGATFYHGAQDGFAGDLGIYTLFGVLGLQVSVAPLLDRREVVTALSIRYF